jgi:hypothetical protein
LRDRHFRIGATLANEQCLRELQLIDRPDQLASLAWKNQVRKGSWVNALLQLAWM